MFSYKFLNVYNQFLEENIPRLIGKNFLDFDGYFHFLGQISVSLIKIIVKVFFKQIAGFVARRIVCTLKVGDDVVAGRRFGMIKFGSRVDVFVPKSSDIKVAIGQKTIAGESVLAVVR